MGVLYRRIILSYISGVKFENLQEQVVEFAKNQVEKYENIKTPVEKVLAENYEKIVTSEILFI